MTQRLEPGRYLVEMTFDKRVDPSTLLRALAAMGWQDVVLDEGSGTTTGAIPRSVAAINAVRAAAPRTAPTPMRAPSAAIVSTPQVRVPLPPTSTPAMPMRPMGGGAGPAFASPVLSRAASATPRVATSLAQAMAHPDAGIVPGGGMMHGGSPFGMRPGVLGAQRLGMLAPDVSQIKTSDPIAQAIAQSPLPPGASPPPAPADQGGGAYPGDSGGGGGAAPSDGGGGSGGGPSDAGTVQADDGGGTSPEQDPSQEPGAPDQGAYDPYAAQDQGAYDPTYQQVDQEQPDEDTEPTDYGDPYAPPEELQAAYDPHQAMQAAFNAAHEGQGDGSSTTSLQDAFNAAHASDVSTAGEYLAIVGGVRSARESAAMNRWAEWGTPQHADHREVRARFRFIGSLAHPIIAQDVPGREWLYVRYLSVEPTRTLGFRVNPHPLHPGRAYEAVLVSRDKLTPHREEVKNMLARMGFQPMKVSLVQRNVRAPGRPTSSLSVWFALVRWLGPASVSLIEDPFYFEQLQEVVPG